MNFGAVMENRRQLRSKAEMMALADAGREFNEKPCGQLGKCPLEEELRRLSAQLLTIQEDERKRISIDLHDGLGQSLTMIKLALENETNLPPSGTGKESSESRQWLKQKVQNAIDEVRRIAMNLRPSTLDDLGILATLSWFLRDFEATCRGIKANKAFSIQENNVPDSLKITIFRILQEAVGNVVKHAKADLIQVSLKQIDDMIHFSIEDNGQGFDLAEIGNYCHLAKGIGLQSMKERAKLSGGTFAIESAAGKGTRISVSWPAASPG